MLFAEPALLSARKLPMPGRLFDPLAMAAWPLVAKALGYTFKIGTSPELRRDGRAVLTKVWASEGVAPPPPALGAVTERYDGATTWIVAYCQGAPVGVLGLLDMRVASVSLDFEKRLPPPGLDLARTRELARLAVVREHRSRAHTVMVGLFREMGAFCKQHDIETLFGGSSRKLFEFYRLFNPSGRLIDPPHKPVESAELSEYYAPLRQFASGQGVLFLMDVRAGSAWAVFHQFLKRRFRAGPR